MTKEAQAMDGIAPFKIMILPAFGKDTNRWRLLISVNGEGYQGGGFGDYETLSTIEKAVNSYATLTAENARLREALKPLANIPLNLFDWPSRPDDHRIMSWNDYPLTVGDLRRASAALSPKQEGKS